MFSLVGGSSLSGAIAAERLSSPEIQQQMQALPSWTINEGQLYCTYEFNNFVESVDFVNRMVEPAEALGHHPDLEISYNTVTIKLTTHDAGGLTQLDFDLAQRISQIVDSMPSGSGCRSSESVVSIHVSGQV